MESPKEYRERVISEFENSITTGRSEIVKWLTDSLDKCDLRGEIMGEIAISNIGEYPEQTLWMMYSMKKVYERIGWNVRFISSNSNPGDSTFYTRCRDVTDEDILDSTLDIYFSISEPIITIDTGMVFVNPLTSVSGCLAITKQVNS